MHYKKAGDVLRDIVSSRNGLSQSDADSRLKKFGLNEIKEAKKVSPFEIFLRQFSSVVIWILIFATVISGFLGEYIDAFVIFIIVLMMAILGFVQEYKVERAIESLKKLTSLKAIVLRDGKRKEIDSKEVVQGDIILLETGNKIPADARLLEAINFSTQEAPLTGESQPVRKSTKIVAEKTPLAERKNMVFSGTIVASGRAKAIVIATGMSAEIGKIASMLQEVKPEPTPLQKKMDQLGSRLGLATLVIAVVIFILGFFIHDEPFIKMILVSVSLAVAAIPEGLPAVVIISLTLGTQRMLKKNALVRRLPSVETLGSTTVICTDKTGTLTANQMTVKKIYANGKIIEVDGVGYETKGKFFSRSKKIDSKEIEFLLTIGALNNNAEFKNGDMVGDPTEGALIISAAKANLHQENLREEYKRTGEIEFSSERKMMTTVHKHANQKIIFVKGAVEVILKNCSFVNDNGQVKDLTGDLRDEILQVNRNFANEALRVLGFAYREGDGKNIEKDLIFVGLQGMIDPPRPEVAAAIEKCYKAGIKVVMITGDNEITAQAIAREIGLKGKSVTGEHLDEVEHLENVVEQISIYARVNPEHKIKIVEAFKKKGHVVAMTGDGINDAPALKKADIGIAMGLSGTDVSKEASSMILSDDNFTTIVNAVEEGRGTYGNIKKYLAHLLSGNIGEVLIILLAILFGLPLPLTATQILLINLITDGLPAIALSADPFEPNSMLRKPRKQDDSIYKGLNPYLIYFPILFTLVSLGIFSWIYFNENNLIKAQTATFVTISMFELYQALSCRSTLYPALKVGIFKNRYLVLSVLSSFVITVALVFIPSLGSYLDMYPLAIKEFVAIGILSSVGAIMVEFFKYKRKESIVKNENSLFVA